MRSTLPLHHFLRPALLLLLLGTATGLSAQRGCDSLSAIPATVTVDLNAGALSGAVPFNVHFDLRVPIPELTGGYSVDTVALVYGIPQPVGNRLVITPEMGGGKIRPQGSVKVKEGRFGVRPLAPGRTYHFEFKIYGSKPDTIPADSATKRPMHIVPLPIVDTVRVAVTPRRDITNHVDADVAFLRSGRAEYLGVGSNAHLYAVPVSKNECTANYRGADHILKRVSVFGGFSVLKLYSDADVDHWYEGGTPMFGLGFNRLPHLGPMRINAGVVLLQQDDANPLVTEAHRIWDPFMSLSLDVELKSLVAPLAALAGLK